MAGSSVQFRRMYATIMGSSGVRYSTLALPDGSGVAGAVVTLTSAGAADTWGAYAQIVLAAVVTQPIRIVEVILSNPNANVEYTIEIATGVAGGGVEIPISVFNFRQRAAAAEPTNRIPVKPSIFCPVGTNLCARVQNSAAAANTIDIKLGVEWGANGRSTFGTGIIF
jgi:hypothetical protein